MKRTVLFAPTTMQLHISFANVCKSKTQYKNGKYIEIVTSDIVIGIGFEPTEKRKPYRRPNSYWCLGIMPLLII